MNTIGSDPEAVGFTISISRPLGRFNTKSSSMVVDSTVLAATDAAADADAEAVAADSKTDFCLMASTIRPCNTQGNSYK